MALIASSSWIAFHLVQVSSGPLLPTPVGGPTGKQDGTYWQGTSGPLQWLTGSQGLLNCGQTDCLNEQGSSVLDLSLFDSMFCQKVLKAIESFGVKGSCPNPGMAHC